MAKRATGLGVIAACVWAGCGGERPSATAIAECLRDAGASVELDAPHSTDPGGENFSPVLTPETELAARGRLDGGPEFELFISTPGAADRAEDRSGHVPLVEVIPRVYAAR